MAHDPKGTGILPYLLLTGTAFCWGGTFVAGKFAIADIPPLAVAAGRFVVSWGPLALMLVLSQKGTLRLPVKDIWPFALLGLTGSAIPNGLVFTGVQYTSATNGALIQAGLPVVSALLAALMIGERLSLRQWAGILVSLLGVAYVVGEGSLATILAFDLNIGNLMVAGAVLSWSLNGVLSRQALHHYSPLAVTTHTVFFGALFLSVLCVTPAQTAPWEVPGWEAIASLLFLAILGNVIGQVWWFQGMRAVGVSRASVFMNLMPLIGVGLAAVLLGEEVTVYHMIGTVTVIGGVLLTIWSPDLLRSQRSVAVRAATSGDGPAAR